MEHNKEMENFQGQLAEIGRVGYSWFEGSYWKDAVGTLYIRNTFGILSVLIKTEGGAYFLVSPNESADSAHYRNACFELFGRKRCLTLPDNILRILKEGTQY